MRYYLHDNIIYYNITAINYCREARKKISTIRKKTVESVRKVHFKTISSACCVPRNPTLWKMASRHGFQLWAKCNCSTQEK